MRGLVIAAGLGRRLGELTEMSPKCLLKVGGETIVERIIKEMSHLGINNLALVRGYMGHMFNLKGVQYFENPNFRENNILHSMMCAENFLVDCLTQREDLLISYSDIVFDSALIKKVTESREPISLLCDTDWEQKYLGRSAHPKSEAELVLINKSNSAVKFGKFFGEQVLHPTELGWKQVEFIGLTRLTPDGIALMLDAFRSISIKLAPDEPFGRARTFQNAYLLDLFQFLVDSGHEVSVTLTTGNWFEIDTPEDLQRANEFFSMRSLQQD